MNIAFLFAYHPDEKWSTPLSLVNAFKHLGHTCAIYSLYNQQKQYSPLGLRQLIQDIQQKKYNYDMIVHMDCGDYVDPLLSKGNFNGVYYVLEAGDDPQAFHKNQYKAPYADLVLSPDLNCVKEYQNRSINAVWWAHFADVLVGQETKPIEEAEYDIVCTRGNGDTPFLDELNTKVGNRFCNKRDYSVYQSELLSNGKIVIQNSRHGELTRRIFEGMMTKRVVLCDEIDQSTGLYSIFTPNIDFLTYKNTVDDAIKTADCILQQPLANLKKIAENGYQKVLKHHTNIIRAQQILGAYENRIL